MKVLMISGSPRKESNTDMALAEMKKIFDESDIECEVVKIGSSNIRGCTDCRKCLETKTPIRISSLCFTKIQWYI